MKKIKSLKKIVLKITISMTSLAGYTPNVFSRSLGDSNFSSHLDVQELRG